VSLTISQQKYELFLTLLKGRSGTGYICKKLKIPELKKALKWVWKILKWVLILFFSSSLLMVILYRFLNPPVTPLMVIRCAGQYFSGKEVRLKKDWVAIEKISPDLQISVVASEDNRFLDHHGFDFKAIDEAQAYNEKQRGKRLHGASTISQQTAKNVFLWPQRSWIRKGLEVYFTELIELIWSKKRIMEVYLNVIEMGDGIYGAEQASQVYFKKPAKNLSRAEAAMLAAILPNPLRFSPFHPSAYVSDRQQWILWNMSNIGSLHY
jgi:monofunctional biosynthetic peptidoglycan transglycosylase